MTCKELIMYILQNNLENENIVKNGVFAWMIDEKQAAARFGVGVSTIRTWYNTHFIEGFQIGESLYFLGNITDPRKYNKIEESKHS